MTLEDLKGQITQNQISDDLIVFKCLDDDFIPRQYIKQIAKSKNLTVHYLDTIKNIVVDTFDIFGQTNTQVDSLRIYCTDSLDYVDSSKTKSIVTEKNLIIVTKKFASKQTESLFSNYTVNVPKLEEWHIKDYIYSVAEGVDTKNLDTLYELCHKDMYRLQQELDKISIFSPSERKYVFGDFITDGVFNDLSTYNIFNFTNAISKRDIQSLCAVYKEIDNADITPMALLVSLYQNFRNIISIQLNPNPTSESTGLSSKQIYAIRYNCGYYNKDQLLKIFEILTDVDSQIKSGNMPMNILVDYLLVKIMSI